MTQLEIVVQSDGSLKRVAIRRSSGLSGFDAVAVDAVNASAPFPQTPAEIRSSDGNVYLDWQFHRDERGCGSFGVDPHIFSTPPPPASEKALQ